MVGHGLFPENASFQNCTCQRVNFEVNAFLLLNASFYIRVHEHKCSCQIPFLVEHFFATSPRKIKTKTIPLTFYSYTSSSTDAHNFYCFLPRSETYYKIVQQIVYVRLFCSVGFILGI
jgi:hypothetical protein